MIEFVADSLRYQACKKTDAMSAALKAEVNAIILTGDIACNVMNTGKKIKAYLQE